MTLLFDHKNRSVVNLPEEQVAAAVASGQFAFRKAVRIPVISPEGETGSIDAGEAPEAFRNGFVFQTRQMSDELQKTRIEAARVEAFDAPVAATAAGILRGGTLGVSDLAAKAVGLDDELLALQQYNPTASTVGEVIGGVGASVLAAPATAALGTATAAKLGGKALARIAGTATAMGVEGAVQSAGSVLSQASLGDPELTTDSALMQLGLGTVLGGGLGAFGKGATEGISSLHAALRNSTLPGATADTIGKAYAKLSGMTKGLNADDSKEMIDIFTKDRARFIDITESPQKFEKAAIDAVANVRKIGTTIADATMAARDAERKTLSEAVSFSSKAEAANLVKKMGLAIKEMEVKPNKSAKKIADEAMAAKNAEIESLLMSGNLNAEAMESAVKKMEEKSASAAKRKSVASSYFSSQKIPVARQIREDLKNALKNAENIGEIHSAVENARIKMDRFILKFNQNLDPGQARQTQELWEGVRSTFAKHMVNTKIYGNYGNRYKEINAAYNRFRKFEDVFDKEMTRDVPDFSGKMVTEVDTAKVLSWFRNPENLTKMRKEMAVDELAESIKQMGSIVSDNNKVKSILPSIDIATKTLDDIRDVRGMALFMNRLEHVTGKALLGGAIGGAAGSLLGGAGGGFGGAAIGFALANPKSVLKILYRLEQLGVAGQNKVQNSVDSFFTQSLKGTLKGVQKYGGGTFKRITAPALIQILQPDGSYEDNHEGAMKALDGLDGMKLDQRLTELNPYLDEVSPEVYANLHRKTMQAAQFVRSKMPGIDQADMFGQYRAMSTSEKEKIDTYADAAFRPARALEELESGMPDPRVFETIGTLYPKMYEDMQRRALASATDKHSTLTYQQKYALGLAFGIPTVPSLANAELLLNDPVGVTTAQPDEQPAPRQASTSRPARVSTTRKFLDGTSTETEKLG